MISGRQSGTGKYSFQEVSGGSASVLVSHMPEDSYTIRIVFRAHGETSQPILKMTEREAILLWSALKNMAADLKWDDRMPHEIERDLKK